MERFLEFVKFKNEMIIFTLLLDSQICYDDQDFHIYPSNTFNYLQLLRKDLFEKLKILVTEWCCENTYIQLYDDKKAYECFKNQLEKRVKRLKISNYIETLNQLREMDYKEYLETDHWLHFRQEAYKWASYKCQLCDKSQTTLNVHHKNYENKGRETFNDIIVLCHNCHKKYHNK